MIFPEKLLWVLLLVPIAAAGLGSLVRSTRLALIALSAGTVFTALALSWAAISALYTGQLLSPGGWLYIDALSAFHLLLMALIFTLSALFAVPYYIHSTGAPLLDVRTARRFAGLWHAAFAAMILVLLSNNLGIIWVGVEATTLLTAFLVCLHISPASLEAAWKYLIICSVGAAFAFMGVLLMAAATGRVSPDPHLLHWTNLRDMADLFNAGLIKPAFIFLVVGYGVKAGLAPLHTWLPDAHSQAPAPVSAVFSGFMLNMALYCIMRHMPLVVPTVGFAWVSGILAAFGLFSIIIAAIFILIQNDIKRFLAYCSIEHIGIIALGLSLGPIGMFAALFHAANHSIAKVLGFFSAGRLSQYYGTTDMRRINGAMRAYPLWGTALLVSILALLGTAPSAVFFSELIILKAALGAGRWAITSVFLIGTSLIFISSLRYVIGMVWGDEDEHHAPARRPGFLEWLVVGIPALLIIGLGLWMPDSFRQILLSAAGIINGGTM